MHVWHIRLFGQIAVSRSAEETFSRFSTRKSGALLAFLAFHRRQAHSREALCDLLWADEPPQTSRARLRVALTSLRHQLEPPGIPAGSVILSDGHEQIQLSPEAVITDVAEVEHALKQLQAPETVIERRIDAARIIAARFTTPLLTGFYEDWVVLERERLAQEAIERLCTLARHLPAETGSEIARYAVQIDPLAEEPLFVLLPLLAQTGQHTVAVRIYQTFRKRWESTMGVPPSMELQRLVDSLPQTRQTTQSAPSTIAFPGLEQKTTTDPAPPHPLPATKKYLPSYLTRFFGRKDEVAALQMALTESRLVTLTGPGGIGKTRLAVETARNRSGSCWFVPLTEAGEAARIPAAVCDALGNLLSARPKTDSTEALLALAADALNNIPGEPLLVMDNLEQIADTAGSLLLSLLERVPNLRLLITSRLRMHLPGEQEFPLSPLPVPDDAVSVLSLVEASTVASVALFLDRARSARPDFQITPRNQNDVLAICQILEGIPLAIELVAARSGALVPSQMREMLATYGGLGVSDRRAREGDRHRSLYTAIDWSYRLLPADLRQFFARLSVFRGGFTTEAAAAVCSNAADTSVELATGESLARLRAHSLVASVADASDIRFNLLESLRSFGIEQLSAEETRTVQKRHGDWFADFAERADSGLSSAQQSVWLERIDAERDNLRATLHRDWQENPGQAVQIAGAVWLYWHLRGRPTEGRLWLDRSLAMVSLPPHAVALERSRWARALHGAGTLAWSQGDGLTAADYFDKALEIRRRLGDLVGVAATLNNRGLLAWSRKELDAALIFLGESLVIRRNQAATTAALASSLLNIGVIHWENGDYAAALTSYREALALCREAGDQVGEGHALNNMGNIALSLGDFTDARIWYSESLALKRTMGYTPGIAATLANLGITEMWQGNYPAATRYLEESLKLHREMKTPEGITAQLRNLGQIAAYQQDWDRSRALLTESLAIRRASDSPQDIGIILEGFIFLFVAQQKNEPAAILLGATETFRAKIGDPYHPVEKQALDRAIDSMRTALGEEPFAATRLQGTHLTEEEAAEQAMK